MQRILTFSQAALQEIDRRAAQDFHIPVNVLMENAGRAVAEHVLAHRRGKGRALIVAGSGNNGGDGLVAARWLKNADVDVTILLVTAREKYIAAAGAQLDTVERMAIPIEMLSKDHAELRDWIVEGEPADVIIDAIFGTGLSRPVDGLPADAIRAINVSARWILAVDIPSGVQADSGEPMGTAIQASETISFCGIKRGLTKGLKFAGKVTVADIGIPRGLLEELADPL